MRLTQHTDYAMRVLMYAGLKGDALSTINEIVERFGIPRGPLMKVVHHLGRKGYLHTVRGKHGGLKLARAAAQISVGAVVRDMEQELGVLGCLKQAGDDCRVLGSCVLRSALREATEAFLEALDRYSLRDLLRAPQPLAHALGMTLPAPAEKQPRARTLAKH